MDQLVQTRRARRIGIKRTRVKITTITQSIRISHYSILTNKTLVKEMTTTSLAERRTSSHTISNTTKTNIYKIIICT